MEELNKKEFIYSLIQFMKNMYKQETIFDEILIYDYYSNESKEINLQKLLDFIRKNHFLTRNIIDKLSFRISDMKKVYFDLFEFEKVVTEDTEDKIQFDMIMSIFLEQNESNREFFYKYLKEEYDALNWEYVFEIIPRLNFPEIEIKDENFIKYLKNMEALKENLESLEMVTMDINETDKTLILEILKTMENNLKELENSRD